MALTQPILYSVSAFPAEQNFTFSFNVIGGDQVVASTLTIKNNATLVTVYQQTITSFQFNFLLPANTLTDGVYYQAYLTTQNAVGQTSAPSNTIQFYCFSLPTFDFSNIPLNNVIGNSNFSFDVSYTQAESEALNQYEFNLYDYNNQLISSSGVLYNTSTTLPLTLSYLFSGFENFSIYYIQCTGVTVHRLSVATPLTQLTVSYQQPSFFDILSLANNCDEGYIYIQSNVEQILGTTNPSPPVYIQNEELDVSGEGEYVNWAANFQIVGNWTLGIWGRNFAVNSDILSMENAQGDKLTIRWMQNTDDTLFAKLTTFPNEFIYGYTISSNSISAPANGDVINIWVRKIDGIYEIIIVDVG